MARTAARSPDLRAIRGALAIPDAPPVDEPLLAESLPELYRQVLDRVATLESSGLRDEAGLIRNDAIRIYSGPWTESASRRLRTLRIHADRVVDGRDRPRAQRRVTLLLARLTPLRIA
jgi:hypothetical protein